MKDLEHRYGLIKSCLDRLGYHMEGLEPYHPCQDRAGNWLAAASTEVEDLLEELELEKKDERS